MAPGSPARAPPGSPALSAAPQSPSPNCILFCSQGELEQKGFKFTLLFWVPVALYMLFPLVPRGVPIYLSEIETLPCETFPDFPDEANHFLFCAPSVFWAYGIMFGYLLVSTLGWEALEGRDCALYYL